MNEIYHLIYNDPEAARTNFLRTGSHNFKPWYKNSRQLMMKYTLIKNFLVFPEKYDVHSKLEKIAEVSDKRLPQKKGSEPVGQYKLF